MLRPGFEPGSRAREATNEELLRRFRDFCLVDLNLAKSTVNLHNQNVSRFMKWSSEPMSLVESETVREYLKTYLDKTSYSYANQLKTLRRFFRDFLERGEAVKSFKLPRNSFTPKRIPTKEQLRKAYNSLVSQRQRAIFLLYATTGLRKSELRKTTIESVDFEQRMIIPYHSTKTKNS